MQLGEVCIKTKGKDAGKKVVVLSGLNKGRVLIDGKNVKRKECNVLHLFPTGEKIKVTKEIKHEELLKLLK